MASKPWEEKPKGNGDRRKLTAESIAWARARAAGRRYPNLIDNMAAARRQAEQERDSGTDGPGFLRKL